MDIVFFLSQLTFFFSVVGRGKAQVIAGCRQAIKNNNVNGLFKIIKAGSLWSRNFEETKLHHLLKSMSCFLITFVNYLQQHGQWVSDENISTHALFS